MIPSSMKQRFIFYFYICLGISGHPILGPAANDAAQPPLFNSLIQLDPTIWETSPSKFEPLHTKFKFKWVSATDHETMRSSSRLDFLEYRLYECIARFREDRLAEVTLLIFSRGDAKKDLGQKEFDELTKQVESSLDAWLGAKGMDAPLPGNALETKRKAWFKFPLRVDLETNFTRNAVDEMTGRRKPRAEFVRLVFTPYDGKQNTADLVKPNSQSSAQPMAVKRTELKERIKHEEWGDVYLDGVPMVDQGAKGYCAVASVERVMRFYGLDFDQNELAKMANSKTIGGTSQVEMFDALKKLGRRFSFTVRELQRGNDKTKLMRQVTDSVDKGAPLLWGVALGIVDETPKLPQANGGHMRLIIGYNKDASEIIYTDSWGAGHEFKRMLLHHAFAITTGLYSILPNS